MALDVEISLLKLKGESVVTNRLLLQRSANAWVIEATRLLMDPETDTAETLSEKDSVEFTFLELTKPKKGKRNVL